MKIEIIKAEENRLEYNEGDVISLGDPCEQKSYLLVTSKDNKCIGAVNLDTNDMGYYYKSSSGFEVVVHDILVDNSWDEWALIKSEDVTLTLNAKNGATQQRNQSSPQFTRTNTLF